MGKKGGGRGVGGWITEVHDTCLQKKNLRESHRTTHQDRAGGSGQASEGEAAVVSAQKKEVNSTTTQASPPATLGVRVGWQATRAHWHAT